MEVDQPSEAILDHKGKAVGMSSYNANGFFKSDMLMGDDIPDEDVGSRKMPCNEGRSIGLQKNGQCQVKFLFFKKKHKTLDIYCRNYWPRWSVYQAYERMPPKKTTKLLRKPKSGHGRNGAPPRSFPAQPLYRS